MKPWLAVLALWSAAAAAAPWQFAEPQSVTGAPVAGVFHHIESSGRKNIAASGDTVAVVWEDNHSGKPEAYIAFKHDAGGTFAAARRISEGGEAYEPGVAALGGGRFLVGWEENGRVHVRTASRDAMGKALGLSSGESGQITVAARGPQLVAAWSERDEKVRRIRVTTLAQASDDTLAAGEALFVDPLPPKEDQLYPSVALTAGDVVVAWEDRRFGHTTIQYAASANGRGFTAPARLNELLPQRSATYGRGTGVARVSLAAAGDNRLLAAWLDKRHFETGYDVYAAWSRDGGHSFGANIKVQEGFGDEVGQWHVAVSADPGGRAVAVWDDDRFGSADIWMAWPEGEAFSANEAVPGAEGDGEQIEPAVCFDENGGIHVVWVSRAAASGPTEIRYVAGRPPPPE
jgi:hypothetical protein